MEKKKKIGIGVAIAVVVIVIAGICIYFAQRSSSDKSNQAYVEKVGDINGTTTGNVNRFAGVVEAQDTWKINLSGDKQVKEVYVQVGDEVAEGDKLFAYDTEDVNSQIA
ncbi:MAG: biotin/lipoyl-binding protein, partial [Lachnospiraceae bacterium]